MSAKVQKFFDSLQRRPTMISGHVASVVIDSTTGEQRRASVLVGGSTIVIPLDATAPRLGAGDAIRLTQYGTPAAAEYRVAGLETGARPGSGAYQVLDNDTVIGTGTYQGGDWIFGKLSGGNVYVEYETGRLYHRIGLSVNGIEYPDGSQLFGHAALDGGDYAADGPNVLIEDTGIKLRNATVDVLTLDTNGVAWAESTFRAGTGNNAIGITATDSQWRLFAGAETPAAAPFRIGKDGSVGFFADGPYAVQGSLYWEILRTGAEANIWMVDGGGTLTNPASALVLQSVGEYTTNTRLWLVADGPNAAYYGFLGAIGPHSADFKGFKIGSYGVPVATLEVVGKICLSGKTPSSDDAAILIALTATNPLSSGGSHGVRDESTYTAVGTGGYASFDAIPTVSGATAYNHVAAFQTRPIFSGSTSIDAVWGLTYNPIIDGPTVDALGVYITDPLGSGAITQLVGVYVGALTRGTSNYGIYTAGTMPSYFGGAVDTGTEYRIGGLTVLKTNAHAVDAGNLWVSPYAGNTTLTGHNNYALGTYTLNALTTGHSNVALGYGVGQLVQDGYQNTAIGHSALAENVSGNGNVAVGLAALNKTTAGFNTAVGAEALKVQEGAYFNVGIGSGAGVAVTTGQQNTLIGTNSGTALTTTSGSVMLGFAAGYYKTGANKLFIDNTARSSEADARTKALIYGVFAAAVANQELYINGKVIINEEGADADTRIEGDTDANLFFVDASADKVGIGTATPAEKLHVVGSVQYTGGLKPYRNATAYTGYVFVPLTAPLTSTSWDGDAYSTTAKTLIDLSAVFGVPADVKAVSVRLIARDSGSLATANLAVYLSPNDTAGEAPVLVRPSGLPNDAFVEVSGVIPCDSNGDLYYQVAASGSGTLDVWLQIWGYWI